MDPKNHTLTELFVNSPILSELLKKVEQLSKLNRLVLEKLDPQLARHCRVLSCNEGILVLSTSTPAWGHTLRFNEIDILSTLRNYPEWCGLKSIRIRVTPHEGFDSEASSALIPRTTSSSSSSLSSSSRFALSNAAADLLNITASQVEADRLKKALSKLATRVCNV